MNRHIPEVVDIGVIIEENKEKNKLSIINETETRKKGCKRKKIIECHEK